MDLADGATNDGLLKRRALGLESRMFDMMGRLHADIFFQRSLHDQRGRRKDQVDSPQRRFLSDGGRWSVECRSCRSVIVVAVSTCERLCVVLLVTLP